MFSIVRAPAARGGKRHEIQFTLGGKLVTASLEDNQASRDFVAMLPVTLEDYASTEKIAYLKKRLSTKGAPEGIDPRKGDLTYYALWGNLAIFQKDFRYSSGLLKLGRVDKGFEALLTPGSASVTIELKNGD
ncbi:cyclophilin [Mesorhizobium sp. M00.F.Ca.ET.149.01.1.1]|nr:cyclophilin [Mesorhizobium sp. M8A.F.Ca.ET.197.01.1.1]TGR39294.1 cyclophilin [bacterium M00.F.Ca.ET.199.01.1.1]TGR46890.1 cyclophilin [Mesorhizobium sp. M8A.F.Ca.ET.198.01.1.1]TGV81926.1 cyclophilin [Mesorhizobium sp. M00.F.Ca.ET.149.01.1.1]